MEMDTIIFPFLSVAMVLPQSKTKAKIYVIIYDTTPVPKYSPVTILENKVLYISTRR